jgi:hypothetical protein
MLVDRERVGLEKRDDRRAPRFAILFFLETIPASSARRELRGRRGARACATSVKPKRRVRAGPRIQESLLSCYKRIPADLNFYLSLTLAHLAPNKEEIEIGGGGMDFKFELSEGQGRWMVNQMSVVDD